MSNRISKFIIFTLIILLFGSLAFLVVEEETVDVSAMCIQRICRDHLNVGYMCEATDPHVYELVYNANTLELKLTRRDRCNDGLP